MIIKNKKPIRASRKMGMAFFPPVKEMSGNPYWPMLESELEKIGVFINHHTPLAFDLKWLITNSSQVKVLSLQYIQQFYKSSSHLKAIIKLFLFAFRLIMARALGYRTVFTLHNLEPTYQIEPAWVDYLGHWIAANLSERVIVHCNEARRLLAVRYGRRKNVFNVDHPNFIDIYPNTISQEAARKQLGLPNNSIVFIFIGGIRPNKGIETLVRAFHTLEDEKFRLVIAGKAFPPESYVQFLQEMATVDHRISFHKKFIPDSEMQVYLNAADIVVLPFAKILTSSTANLAMSFSRPVIVPKLGCLTELVENNFGWLYESNNFESLAKAMQSAAISDVEKIGKLAYNKVSFYSPERFATQTFEACWD